MEIQSKDTDNVHNILLSIASHLSYNKDMPKEIEESIVKSNLLPQMKYLLTLGIDSISESSIILLNVLVQSSNVILSFFLEMQFPKILIEFFMANKGVFDILKLFTTCITKQDNFKEFFNNPDFLTLINNILESSQDATLHVLILQFLSVYFTNNDISLPIIPDMLTKIITIYSNILSIEDETIQLQLFQTTVNIFLSFCSSPIRLNLLHQLHLDSLIYESLPILPPSIITSATFLYLKLLKFYSVEEKAKILLSLNIEPFINLFNEATDKTIINLIEILIEAVQINEELIGYIYSTGIISHLINEILPNAIFREKEVILHFFCIVLMKTKIRDCIEVFQSVCFVEALIDLASIYADNGSVEEVKMIKETLKILFECAEESSQIRMLINEAREYGIL